MPRRRRAMSANEITVGSEVRSFDFDSRDLEGERASYVEGHVVTFLEPGQFFAPSPGPEAACFHDCARYVIKVTRRVGGGRELPDGPTYVFPPVNGIPKLFGGVTNGVEPIVLV
jgi:hypothetical protein